MSVSDGELANENTFNTSFVSREVDDNKAAKFTLDDPDTSTSGPTISNVQREHNSIGSFVGKSVNTAKDLKPTWNSNAIGSPNQAVKDRVDSVQAQVETNDADIDVNAQESADIRTTQGTGNGDTDLGVGFGTIISANTTVKQALIDLEAALEPITDALDFQGLWDANANSPTLTSSTGTKGHFYIVSVAGTTNLDGITDWQIGDWAIFDGTVWRKVDNTDQVSSVNGQTGNVSLGLDNLNDVNAPTPNDLDLLQWNNGAGEWQNSKNVDVSGTASALQRLVTSSDTTANLEALARKAGAIYFSTDENIYYGDDGTNLIPIGSGSGQGGINYISNPDFETGISDWSEYDDGASPDPVDGTGSTAANITTAPVSSGDNNLRGDQSFLASKGAADAQGEGFSIDFSIDNQDRGKNLFVSFDYKTGGSYVSGDFAVYVYDVGNATLLGRVDSRDNGDILNTGGNDSRFYGRFQADATSTTYRLIFHYTNNDTDSKSLILDNVSVGPDTLVPGAIIEHLGEIPITTSWDGGTATTVAYGRRVGNYLEVEARILLSGAPPSVALTVDTPLGKTMDANKLPAGGSLQPVGYANFLDNGVYVGLASLLAAPGSNNIEFRAQNQTTTYSWPNIDENDPFTWGNTDEIRFRFSIPIEEWSTGAMLSTTEAVFSTAKCRATLSANQVITGDASEIKVLFDQVDYDSTSSFDTTNNEYIVPRSGVYNISFQNRTNDLVAGNANDIFVRRNGSVIHGSQEIVGAGVTTHWHDVSFDYELTKGDVLTFHVDNSGDGDYTIVSSSSNTHVAIHELPDFSIFSVYGEQEYLETIATADTTTGAADTYADAAGLNLTLTPGVWDLGYDVALWHEGQGGAVDHSINAAIRDGADNVISGTVGLSFVDDVTSTANRIIQSVSRQTRITVTETTTYKLSIRSSLASGTARCRLIADSFTGAMTDPDNDSVLWARRVS